MKGKRVQTSSKLQDSDRLETYNAEGRGGQIAHQVRCMNDPRVLFPGLSVLILALVWSATFMLVNIRIDSAVNRSESTTGELADTYEAQLVRALREIEQTLLLVDFVIEPGRETEQLRALSRQGLLPPDLLFRVHIFDISGDLLATTHTDDSVVPPDDQGASGQSAELRVSEAWYESDSDRWWLDFSRGLFADNGSLAGVVVVSVDAEFFVSIYETDRMGEAGMLGMIGTDGIVRAGSGTGGNIYGGNIPLNLLLTTLAGVRSGVAVFEYPMDGIQRYTAAREIFGFPLALVVGLSVDEQLAASRADNRVLLWQSTAVSIVLLLLFGLFGFLGWQLQRSRAAVLAEQLAHAKDVEHMALHDGLTGLPNRILYSQLLAQGIQAAKRNRRSLAVLFLDLDKFKLVNDTLGHDAGDQLLIEIGRRVSEVLRGSDVVARLSGDEFIILLPDVEDDKQAGQVADKVLAAVCEPYRLAGRQWRITVSIGISIYPRHGEDEQTLIRHADTAMYNAKHSGRNMYRFYEEGMQGKLGKQ